MTSDADQLTPACWPRPRFGGWPVPWVSPQGDLSTMHDGRANACATGSVCAVCGFGYQLEDRAIALIKLAEPGQVIPPETWATGEIMAMDNAVMHARCARLAYSTCPALLKLRRDGLLLPVDVPANRADITIEDNGRAHAVFDAALCRPLPLPEAEWPEWTL